MKKYIGLLLSGAMLLSLVGCSGSSSSSSEASATSEASASASTEGSSIVVAIGAQFDTLDPALSTTVYNAYVINSIYSGLYSRNEDGTTSYDLAESAETSEDGLTWTFHLREDAKFNDGTPITSANYEYAYLRALSYGPDNAFRVSTMKDLIVGAEEYSDASYLVEDFDCTVEDHSGVGIECPDDYTLVLKLNYPLSYLDIDLSGGGVFSPLPLDTPQHESAWSLTPGYATCGEYKLVEFSVNDKAVLTKDETCLHADEVLMENITFQVMTDSEAQYAAWQTGDVDVALNITTETANTYKGTDALWVMEIPSVTSVVVNTGEKGPEALKDVNVRHALYIALDKQALVDVIGGEETKPILDGYVPFGFAGVNDDFRQERDDQGYDATYDPELAKQLLNEAGYDESNPLKLTYKYSKNGINEDVAVMLQSMWQALGCVEISFDAVESGVYYDQLDEGNYDLGRYGLQASDSPMSFLKNWTSDNQVYDMIGDDDVYDEMLDEAKYLVDADEFNEALHAAEDYLVQEQYLVWPLFQNCTTALKNEKLQGLELHGTYPYYSKCTFSE